MMGVASPRVYEIFKIMGLTKQYLRYVQKASFGVVNSRKGDAIIVHNGHQGTTVASPALEDVVLWDLRKGEKVRSVQGVRASCFKLRNCFLLHSLWCIRVHLHCVTMYTIHLHTHTHTHTHAHTRAYNIHTYTSDSCVER